MSLFKNRDGRQKRFLLDMTALSIFNQKVITPLLGASNFRKDTQRYGVSKVLMGFYSFDLESFDRIDKITKQFFAITKDFNIDIVRLNISSIEEFVTTWLGVMNSNEK